MRAIPSRTQTVASATSHSTREKHARTLAEQGRLADALIQWRVLRTLEPDNDEYAAQERILRAMIAARTEQHLRTAQAALGKNDTIARREFLAALALDPSNDTALEQLRGLEFDRVWRMQSQKLEALKSQENRKTPTASDQERFYFELAAFMSHQGDHAGAVREMQKYLNSYPRDTAARRIMADSYTKLAATQREQGQLEAALQSLEQARRFGENGVATKKNNGAPAQSSDTELQMRQALANEYYEKALRVHLSNLPQAIELYQKALEYDSNHAKARAKLNEALRMQKNLKSMGH